MPTLQPQKLRFLLLDREAPADFGWWPELTRPGLNSGRGRAEVVWQNPPVRLLGLGDPAERHALLLAARVAAWTLRGAAGEPAGLPAVGEDAALDRALAEPRFGNPLNLVMAGVIACDQPALGALGLRRLDAAARLAERARLRVLAASHGIDAAVIRHIVAFNGLAGGLPVGDLPGVIGQELAAWGTSADARAVATLLAQEFPGSAAEDGVARLGTIQPDLIGESVIVQSFEGEPWLAWEAVPTVRRAYGVGQGRAAETLVRVVQDFAYALEEQGSTTAERARATAILGWLTALAEGASNPLHLLPLVSTLPADRLVLREPAAVLTGRLAESLRAVATEPGDNYAKPILAALLNNLAFRLSKVGQREDALAAAEEALSLYRTLAAARPNAFTPNLAASHNTLAVMLRELGRRKDALAAAEEAVRLYRALAAARADAFTPAFACSLWVLGGLKTEAGDQDGGIDALTEGLRCLTPVFEAYPMAVAGLMAGLLQSYSDRCEAVGCETDNELLARIAARLQQMEALHEPTGDSGSRTPPDAAGFVAAVV